MDMDKSVCLCMMVCNESHVIARALLSAKPHIDYWVITDTGSKDNTPDIIAETLAGIPGELHRTTWVNFGHNRSVLMQLAHGKADYLLLMDADMVANVHAPFKHKLDLDAYNIYYQGHETYAQIMLVAGHHHWRYVGVTHEYIDAPGVQPPGLLPELTLSHYADGGNRADKFQRDIRLLTEELARDPGNPRNIFYLAQSYKDLGEYREALVWYQKRAAIIDSWDEERWFAQMQAGRMKMLCGYPQAEIVADLLQAYAMRPTRLEPIYLATHHLRERGEWVLAWLICAFVKDGMTYPEHDILFIDTPVYRYLLLLEYAVCAYATGHFALGLSAFNTILALRHLPSDVEASALRGQKLCLENLFPPSNEPVGCQNRIVVISVFNNAGPKLKAHVAGLLAQNYQNCHFYFIDDASTDDCRQYLPPSSASIGIIRHQQRLGLAACWHEAIHAYCSGGDLVVLLDSDDVLQGDAVLAHINQFFNQQDCWVMYGRSIYTDGSRSNGQAPFTDSQALQQFRQQPLPSRPLSFRAGLFQRIARLDAGYGCLKTAAGQWMDVGADRALMAALFELAGFAKVRYSQQILAVHSKDLLQTEHWLQAGQLKNNVKTIASQRPFVPLDAYQEPLEAMLRAYQ